MKTLILWTVAGCLLLTGCGDKEETEQKTVNPRPNPAPIKVDPADPNNGTATTSENPVTAEEFKALVVGEWKIDNINNETKLNPAQLSLIFTFASDGVFIQKFPSNELSGKWTFQAEGQKLITTLDENQAEDKYTVLSITANQFMFFDGKNIATLKKI